MREAKKFIQHELINLLTIINILVDGGPVRAVEKKRIKELIKLASILISYEDIFIGKKIETAFQKVDLKEVLEMVVMVQKGGEQNKGTKVDLLSEKSFVKADPVWLRDALDKLIGGLFGMTPRVEFEFEAQHNKLIIKYKNVARIKFKKEKLIQCLNKKDVSNNKIELQLALEIFKINNIKLKASEDKIEIIFPR
ncbi:hypothetical protein KAR91_25185 [Candidatus Pacearchaeota archaeon]|nr:hypothetical protein [Candidatus Pacearchaeota archaeon]